MSGVESLLLTSVLFPVQPPCSLCLRTLDFVPAAPRLTFWYTLAQPKLRRMTHDGNIRLVFQLSWWLGLISIVAAIVVKLLSFSRERVHVTGHTLFLVAGTFFLCALATREMQKSQ